MDKEYHICFIGLGSIAKRHIRNIHSIMEERRAQCKIDVVRSGKGSPINDEIAPLIDKEFFSIEEAGRYDAVFVTNPTSMHFDAIQRFQSKTDSFFIEKPLSHTSDININSIDLENKIYYVACPLRYTDVIQHLKDTVDFAKVRSVRVLSASYLPEWRPETDYRSSYSAKKELGGGVSIDLIHEWDYITYLMGMPVYSKSIIGKVSDLEIDSDDIAVYIAKYENMVLELHLDYFTKQPTRMMYITTDDSIIEVDILRQMVKKSDSDQCITFKQERDDYQKRELNNFFDIIENKSINENNLTNALKVLKLAEGK